MKPLYVLLDTDYENLLNDLQLDKRRTVKSLVQESLEMMAIKSGIIPKPIFEIRKEMGKLKPKTRFYKDLNPDKLVPENNTANDKTPPTFEESDQAGDQGRDIK